MKSQGRGKIDYYSDQLISAAVIYCKESKGEARHLLKGRQICYDPCFSIISVHHDGLNLNTYLTLTEIAGI